MQDENVIVNEKEEDDIVKMINEVKANSVPKDLYDKEKKKNLELSKALLNNDYSQDDNQPKVRSAKEIAEDFFKAAADDNIRDGFKLAVEYREARLRESNVDPFVNNNPLNPPSSSDFMDADNMAEVFKEMVDNSDDNASFGVEYNRNVSSYKN